MMVVCVVIIETTKPTTPSSRKDSDIDATAQHDTPGRSILSQVIYFANKAMSADMHEGDTGQEGHDTS